jgi:phosphatidylethanolamine-binding protein (PEBP) family uncharacterized protein
MQTASTAMLTALTLAVLAHGGVLACDASDAGGGSELAAGSTGVAGATVTAGAGGAAATGAAGAPTGGAATAGAGGAIAGGAGGAGGGSAGASAGSAGVAGSAAGAGGASGGAGGAAGSAGNGGMGGAAPFELTSPSFMNKMGCGPSTPSAVAACDKIPETSWLPTIATPNDNHSPELDWTAGPSGTLSYAIAMHDLTNNYDHWAVWNIPPTTHQLPASLPAGADPAGITGAKQTSFYANKDAYAGPGAHGDVYQFTVYALKVASISPTVSGDDPPKGVRSMLEGSADVLAKATLVAACPF